MRGEGGHLPLFYTRVSWEVAQNEADRPLAQNFAESVTFSEIRSKASRLKMRCGLFNNIMNSPHASHEK